MPADIPSADARLDTAREIFARVVADDSGGLQPRLVAALRAVRREDFAGPPPWYISTYPLGKPDHIAVSDPIHLYQDVLIALDRAKGINNGEPVLHARMLAALAPPVGGTVLHIGVGGGFYTAVLAELVGSTGHVIGFEIEDRLAVQAATALQRWPHVRVEGRSGTGDALPMADAIYVNAGATRPHALWLDALKIGGRLLFPLASAGFAMGVTVCIERRDGGFAVRMVSPSAFISCAGANDMGEGQRVADALRRGRLYHAQSLIRDHVPDDSAVLIGDGWWLSSRPLPP